MGVMSVLLGLVLFGLYEYGGGRYYWELSDFVKSQDTTEKKAEMDREVFGSSLESTYGGIFIMTTDKGMWVWGKNWPKFFTKEDGVSAYYFFDICNQENLRRAEQLESISPARREIFSDLDVWQKKLKLGDYVFIEYRADNSQIMEKVWAYGGWYFLGKSLSQQCAR